LEITVVMLIGIVGKPNCGKSTFFKASTLANVLIANYPFATIKPNHGCGFVRIDCVDKFFNTQCNPRVGYCIDHQRFVAIDLLDVAGLVPGAHEGLGMGNAFLDDLRQADVLIHVIDCAGSTNEKGEPVEPGSYNPSEDIKFLEIEIDEWYLGILKKGWDKFARQVNQEHKELYKEIAKQFSGLKATEEMIKGIIEKLKLEKDNAVKWTEDDLKNFTKELRKTTKPMIIAANKMDIPVADENLKRLQKEFPEYVIVPCSAESELALKEAAKKEMIKYIPGNNNFEIIGQLTEQQKNALEFIRKNILEKFGSTGAQAVLNKAVFDILKYIPIFPGGVSKLTDQYGRVLPDCFLLPEKSTALDFAFKIHTDLGESFIRAIDVKTKRTVGKEHLLKYGDVVEIISGK